MSDVKIKSELEKETSASSKLPVAPENICDVRCTVCNSDHIKEIHNLKKAGNYNRAIIQTLRDKYNFTTSESTLSRHFKKYEKQKLIISSQIINDDLIEEATKQAVHTKKLVELIDLAFIAIKNKINNGYNFDVADLDKLLKLRYQIMDGQDTDENDVLAIFQKASNKYGLNLQQGVLFKPSI